MDVPVSVVGETSGASGLSAVALVMVVYRWSVWVEEAIVVSGGREAVTRSNSGLRG